MPNEEAGIFSAGRQVVQDSKGLEPHVVRLGSAEIGREHLCSMQRARDESR